MSKQPRIQKGTRRYRSADTLLEAKHSETVVYVMGTKSR
jgi:hypothetical protein